MATLLLLAALAIFGIKVLDTLFPPDRSDPDHARKMAESEAAIAKSRAKVAKIQAEMDARYGKK